MVVELAHGGRTAALRPYDGGPEFTALWVELCTTGKWKRSETKEAAN
jgi:hypothetical protein